MRDTDTAEWNTRFEKDKQSFGISCTETVYELSKTTFIKRLQDSRYLFPTEQKPFSRSFQLSSKGIDKNLHECIKDQTIFSFWFEKKDESEDCEDKYAHYRPARSIYGDAYDEVQYYLSIVGEEVSRLVRSKFANFQAQKGNEKLCFKVEWVGSDGGGTRFASSCSKSNYVSVKLWIQDDKQKQQSRGILSSLF